MIKADYKLISNVSNTTNCLILDESMYNDGVGILHTHAGEGNIVVAYKECKAQRALLQIRGEGMDERGCFQEEPESIPKIITYDMNGERKVVPLIIPDCDDECPYKAIIIDVHKPCFWSLHFEYIGESPIVFELVWECAD